MGEKLTLGIKTVSPLATYTLKIIISTILKKPGGETMIQKSQENLTWVPGELWFGAIVKDTIVLVLKTVAAKIILFML